MDLKHDVYTITNDFLNHLKEIELRLTSQTNEACFNGKQSLFIFNHQ